MQESREHTPCQLQGHRQITPRLPLCPSRMDQNQLWFPQPWLSGISLPRALALHSLYNSGCRFLRAIEVTVWRMEITGERLQQRQVLLGWGQNQKENPMA